MSRFIKIKVDKLIYFTYVVEIYKHHNDLLHINHYTNIISFITYKVPSYAFYTSFDECVYV